MRYKTLPAGEVPWVMRMIKAHHAEASRKGVKVVHFCGFDSIPSDLGVTFMVDHMQEKLNRSARTQHLPALCAHGTC